MQTPYIVMPVQANQIRKQYSFCTRFFAWVTLAGYIVLPNTSTSIQHSDIASEPFLERPLMTSTKSPYHVLLRPVRQFLTHHSSSLPIAARGQRVCNRSHGSARASFCASCLRCKRVWSIAKDGWRKRTAEESGRPKYTSIQEKRMANWLIGELEMG